ncbi:MAG TPA: HEAT repeat domain-containing protein [Polyangiales bacterium]|nr:HEAT repeat domain-containing protein [Polyangiales bacterium]
MLAAHVASAERLSRFGPDADTDAVLLSRLTAQPEPPVALRDALLLALARRASATAVPEARRLLLETESPPSAAGLLLAAVADAPARAALQQALAREESHELAAEMLARIEQDSARELEQPAKPRAPQSHAEQALPPEQLQRLAHELSSALDPQPVAFELARQGGVAGVLQLMAAAKRDPKRAGALSFALAAGLRRARPQLTAAEQNDADAQLRAQWPSGRALRLRGLARDPTLAADLAQRFSQPIAEAELRAATAFACEASAARAVCAGALPALLAHESDPEAFRREASAAFELRVAVPYASLAPHFDDPDTAAEALLLAATSAPSPDEPRLARALRRALRAHGAASVRTRAAAALALALLHDPSAVPALLDALDDPADAVHRAALRALAQLGGARVAHELLLRARVEPRSDRHGALLDAERAARDTIAPELLSRGDQVLGARLQTGSARPLADVLLPDGRTLRIRCEENGELLLPNLPDAPLSVSLAP